MKEELYSPFLKPIENHKVVTVGAYKYTRHPMYTVFALVGFLLTISNPNLLTGVLFVLLLIVPGVTADKEENLPAERNDKYRGY